VEERFWSRVNKTKSCWLWTGPLMLGYGTMKRDGKMIKTHRLSWELHFGPIPDGIFVCHNCPGGDNRACVNPSHLWLGDVKANTADAAAKGSMRRGAAHYKSRLTEEQVSQIRAHHANGVSQRELATIYGVVHQTIEWIVNRKTWKHVSDSSTLKTQ
jgi:DNA-binding transcriptional regulator YiaG